MNEEEKMNIDQIMGQIVSPAIGKMTKAMEKQLEAETLKRLRKSMSEIDPFRFALSYGISNELLAMAIEQGYLKQEDFEKLVRSCYD